MHGIIPNILTWRSGVSTLIIRELGTSRFVGAKRKLLALKAAAAGNNNDPQQQQQQQ